MFDAKTPGRKGEVFGRLFVGGLVLLGGVCWAVAETAPGAATGHSASKHWAFRPPRAAVPPAVQDASRVRNPIDAFVLARLEREGLEFSPDADRRILLRRLTFDIRGLPASENEVGDFLQDSEPGAYERLVERLLASPHYGERWGRHWLDIAGYSDTAEYDGDQKIVVHNEGIWRYRDWVIDAFNYGMPYDRFVTLQLAGDELVDWRAAKRNYTPKVLEHLVATGFLRQVPDLSNHPEIRGERYYYEILFDIVEQVSSSLLGLTMRCAQCHDHKLEPISQRDYYRLLAAFAPAYNPQQFLQRRERVLSDLAPEELQAAVAHNETVEEETKELRKNVLVDLVSRLRRTEEADERTKLETEITEVRRKIDAAVASRKKPLMIQALWNVGEPPDVHVFTRGNYERPARLVTAGFPEILGGEPVNEVPGAAAQPPQRSSRPRLALARWLTRPEHPITARLWVNRVWSHFFGRGLSVELGNLGRSGTPPSHPDLLDWLAVDFVRSGFDTQRLQRLILTSTTYRQASVRPLDTAAAREAERRDGENVLLWRQNVRRLEAEIVRDRILAVSGVLDRGQGGEGVLLEAHLDGTSTEARDKARPTQHWRRSIYLFARRNYPLRLLELFDSPTSRINSLRRQTSATVLQSLAQLNSEFFLEHAAYTAERIRRRVSGRRFAEWSDLAYRLVLSRLPDEEEGEASVAFLDGQVSLYVEAGSAAHEAQDRALADLCHMLLASYDFLYLD
jgi:hypothetical protein